MNKFLEIITAPIAAGGQSRFELSGDYFEIIDSAYPVTVLLEDRNGAQIGRMSGAEASYFLRDTPYTAITIASAQAQTVRIAFGSGEAGNRRTAGVVQVVDGGKSRTMAGTAFIFAASVNTGAGVDPAAQLWNPPGSGKNLFVKSARVSSTVTQAYGLKHITALGTGLIGPVAVSIVPKRVGTTGAAQAYKTGATNFNGTIAGAESLMTANLAANQVDSQVFQEPIVVFPGQGLNVYGTVANSLMICTFEFFEEVI